MSHILNQAQLDQMAEKREAGWSYARIAKWFEAQGVHVASQTIAWQCVRLGIIGPRTVAQAGGRTVRSEEHTSELQSIMRISYAVFCLKKTPETKTTIQE